MFALHDRLRRRICLAGFLAMALAPTLSVLAWGVSRRLPSHVRAEAARLSRQLGMDVSLEAVEHPEPGVVRYLGLELSNPENGQTAIRCRRLEARTKTLVNAKGQSRPTLFLGVWEPQIETAQIAEVGQLARRGLGLRAGNAEYDVLLAAKQLELKNENRSQILFDVKGGLETSTSDTKAWSSFHLGGDAMEKPVCICIGRNRQIEPTVDWFWLDTAAAALPCDLLSLGVAPMRSLGVHARFHGVLEATLDGQRGSITGELFDVDLDRVVTDRFTRHRLAGKANITIEQAAFHEGRLVNARGMLMAGPGQVSRSLVEAAVAQLGLEPGPPLATPEVVLPYEQLAFHFDIGLSGLLLEGGCQGAQPGAMMRDARGDILRTPARMTPMVALLRTLAPRSAPEAPVSPQTDWLSRRLPLGEKP
jgi:hypothetical protein